MRGARRQEVKTERIRVSLSPGAGLSLRKVGKARRGVHGITAVLQASNRATRHKEHSPTERNRILPPNPSHSTEVASVKKLLLLL